MTEAEELFEKGVEASDTGNWISALALFEKAVQLQDKPVFHSCLAACIAKERGQYNKAVQLCNEALEKEPENPLHYLNLGRISLFQGRKDPERTSADDAKQLAEQADRARARRGSVAAAGGQGRGGDGVEDLHVRHPNPNRRRRDPEALAARPPGQRPAAVRASASRAVMSSSACCAAAWMSRSGCPEARVRR